MVELELQQARYEASLGERRYAACDLDNRLIAAQLEKSWEAALGRVVACEARLAEARMPNSAVGQLPDVTGLAENLAAAWNAPTVTMRARQKLLRTLVIDIIAGIDEGAADIVLTIHWRGGQHSQLRVRKPKAGEHGCHTPAIPRMPPWRSSAPWRQGGPIRTSPLSSTAWPSAREKPGRPTV